MHQTAGHLRDIRRYLTVNSYFFALGCSSAEVRRSSAELQRARVSLLRRPYHGSKQFAPTVGHLGRTGWTRPAEAPSRRSSDAIACHGPYTCHGPYFVRGSTGEARKLLFGADRRSMSSAAERLEPVSHARRLCALLVRLQ
jgi:hypothetical protein